MLSSSLLRSGQVLAGSFIQQPEQFSAGGLDALGGKAMLPLGRRQHLCQDAGFASPADQENYLGGGVDGWQGESQAVHQGSRRVAVFDGSHPAVGLLQCRRAREKRSGVPVGA